MAYNLTNGVQTGELRRRIDNGNSGTCFEMPRGYAREGNIGPIFLLRQEQEKILEGNRKRYWALVDLEKAWLGTK